MAAANGVAKEAHRKARQRLRLKAWLAPALPPGGWHALRMPAKTATPAAESSPLEKRKISGAGKWRGKKKRHDMMVAARGRR